MKALLPRTASRRARKLAFHALQRASFEALETRTHLAAHIIGSSTSYSNIQAAVNAASAGAVITVDAGTYPELVTITKSLTIQGAQSGVDARSNVRRSGANESIVTGTVNSTNGMIESAFYVNANDVTIDGFTVQGNTDAIKYGAGIVIAPNRAGARIVNNIIQNNISGLFLSNNSTTDAAVIQHNYFNSNNNDGVNGGRGIYTDESISGGNLTNVTIDSNVFIKNFGGVGTTNLEAAISLESGKSNSQSNIRITNNMMDSDGKGVLMWNASNITLTGNVVTYSRDVGSGAFRFEGADSNITITGNELYNSPGIAIHIDEKAVPGDNKNFTITGNNIYANSLDKDPTRTGGLVIESKQYTGALTATGNWWGSATGPSGDGTGTGDAVLARGASVTFTGWATAPVFNPDIPYWGLPQIDGVPIQAEDFDHGGEGVAYHDDDVDNDGGRYRPYQSVDTEQTTDTTGDYDVFSVQAGEWLGYTVNVSQAGSYRFDFRVASGQTTPGKFHVEVDGVNVTGPISTPNTGGASSWQTFSKTNVQLPAGQHVMKLVFDSVGSDGTVARFNWFQFTYAGTPTVPSAPTNLAATAISASQINLTWTNTANNQSGYNIDRSTDNVTFAPLARNVPTASYVDLNLTPGTTYYYEVRATNAIGDSPNSNIANATTLPASTIPTYLSDLTWFSATAGFGSVQKDKTINGNTITLNGTAYPKGLGTHAASTITYQLNGQYNTFISDVGVDDEVNGKGIGSVDFKVIGDGVTLFDSGVLNNGNPPVSISVSVSGVQQLQLVATNGVSGIDFDHADWAGAYLLGAPAKPSAPTGLSAQAISASQINLSWTNTANNQTGFNIDRSTDGTTFTPLTTVGQNVTSYSDTNLTSGTIYYYRVRATNKVGDSDNSNIASDTTFAPNLITTYVSDLTWTSATTGFGTIHKDASINGNPINLKGVVYTKGIGTHAASTITYALNGKYTMFASDVGVDDEVSGTGSVDFKVIGDGVTLFDSGVLHNGAGAVHVQVSVANVQTLSLQATNGVAGIDYDHADWAGAYLLRIPSKPSAPTGLSAGATSASQINLAWTNTADNQTGFNIDRSTDGVTFTPFITVGANVTTYSDTGLTAGTKYYYRVRATNAQGDSDNSNIASDTTFAANAVTTYISDLPWTSATTGYGTIHKDATINGNPIKLHGTTYAKGIGTHAASTIVYTLNSQYTTFTSDVGVDDEVSGTGSVDFQVIGDGKVLFDSGVVHNGAVPTHISVSVTGVTTLTLKATNGVSGIDYDHADWAGAYLLGTPVKPSAPIGLGAQAVSGSQINLYWTNTASNQTAVSIERSTDDITFTPLTTVAGSAATFSDTSLAPNTRYYYRVRSTNAGGSSDPSNEATDITYAAGQALSYLSDRAWVSATAGFGTTQLDKTIKGNTLKLRGTSYAKGLGSHANSSIVYNLAGGFTAFSADIGIDDEVAGLGSVKFQVLGDGVVLFDSGTLTGKSAVMHISVNISGVQQLTLVANSTIAGTIDYDHVDWANAQLLSAPTGA